MAVPASELKKSAGSSIATSAITWGMMEEEKRSEKTEEYKTQEKINL